MLSCEVGHTNYHIYVRTYICSANQWTGFYVISASVVKGLITKNILPHKSRNPEIMVIAGRLSN